MSLGTYIFIGVVIWVITICGVMGGRPRRKRRYNKERW
jgi:hypothetical protein